MIRVFIILSFFILYGNFSYYLNDLMIFSLINIAFFSIIKSKKIKLIDYLIFVLAGLVVEILIGLPLFISASLIILPIYLTSYFINNFSMNYIVHSISIFFLSFLAIFLLDQTIMNRLFDIQYFLLIVILIFPYLSLRYYGKE